MRKKDPETGRPLVPLILDRAKQKGTGKWTSQNALDLGIPTPTIDAAVSARNMSALKDERITAAKALKAKRRSSGSVRGQVGRLHDALLASIIVSYAQGFHLMRSASNEYGYDIPFGEVARIWRGGCIIRSKLLDPIAGAFSKTPDLHNLILNRHFAESMRKSDVGLREVIKLSKTVGVPLPAMSASLDYYDAYRSERLPANLIQALRDRFGAHGYERVDRPGEFHGDWSS